MDLNRHNCPLFNTGIYVEKVNATEAKIGMCPFQKLSDEYYSSIDFANNDYLEKLRAVDTNVEQCKTCAFNESHGNQSHRQGHINAGNQVSDTKVLTTLTYNCENVCNLTCLTCGPKYSSKWKPLYEKMGYANNNVIKVSTHKNILYQDLDLRNLKFLHFQGGEPLLTQDHKEIIQQLDQQNNLENVIISYNTNGTTMVDPELIELWKKAKLVKLYFSIDAVGEQFELIRNPANWKQVESMLFSYRDLNVSNLWLEIGTSVSLANLFYLQDLITWRDQQFATMLTGDKINIYVNPVGGFSHGGTALRLNNISQSIKIAALDYVNSLTDDSIRTIMSSMLNNITSNDKTSIAVEYLDTVDKFKLTNWRKTLSKLHQYINE